MPTDYYTVFGLSRSASMSEIRAAFRQKVKEVHPDVNDHPDANDHFMHVRAAYDVLSNRKKRREYESMNHDEYVKQHGGYTSDELDSISETDIVVEKRSADIDIPAESDPPRADREATASDPDSSESTERRWEWILQGRTSTSSGLSAYLIRLTIYAALLGVVVTLIRAVGGNVESGLMLLMILAATRGVYLIGFERLRTRYVKIDDNPEPDAYTIPYALMMGIIGGVGTSGHILANMALPTLITAPATIFTLLGMAVYIVGYIGAILSVGWGVADDSHNLKENVSPPLWNFVVQLPVLILISQILTENSSLVLLAVVVTGPFLVGTIYLLYYHRAVGSEINWRLQQRTIYPT